jgi:hypothetical protein
MERTEVSLSDDEDCWNPTVLFMKSSSLLWGDPSSLIKLSSLMARLFMILNCSEPLEPLDLPLNSLLADLDFSSTS